MDLSGSQFLPQQIVAFGNEIGRQRATDPQAGMAESMINALKQKITDLEQQLHAIRNQFSFGGMWQGPQREVFIAAIDPAHPKRYQERIPENNVIVDFSGGRVVTSDADPGALLALGDGEGAILAIRDAKGDVIRNVPIAQGCSTTSGTVLGGSGDVTSESDGTWAVGDGPVSEYVITDIYAYEGSSGNCQSDPPKLIGIKRLNSYDSCGKLIAISDDAEYTIATGCCPDMPTISSPGFATSAANLNSTAALRSAGSSSALPSGSMALAA